MSSGGRNAPEWFGGGFGSTTTATDNNSNSNGDVLNNSNGGSSSKSKKKHRRSKSDSSYQKSSSRKAAERKEKRKSKEHRRGKSRENLPSPIAEEFDLTSSLGAVAGLVTGVGTGTGPYIGGADTGSDHGEAAFSSLLQQDQLGQTSAAVNSSYSRNRNEKQHHRSYTMPSPDKKRSTSFLDRIFGFGRSEPKPISALESATTLIPAEQALDGFDTGVGAKLTATAGLAIAPPPVHLHVHKIEEKIDTEELRPLAPPSVSVSPYHRNQNQSLNHPLNQPLHQQHNLYPNIDNLPNEMMFPPTQTPPNQLQKQQQRLYEHHVHVHEQRVPISYQNQKLMSHTSDSGMESDDLLTYSDDDTTITYQPSYLSLPSQQQSAASSNSMSTLYPSYLSNEDFQNHEAYQVMQQQRMMALGGSQSQNSINSQLILNRGYGAINSSTMNHNNNDLLPPLNQQTNDQSTPQTNNRKKLQQQQQQQQIHQSKLYRSFSQSPSNNNINDMYISEDDTMSSYHTQETYRNVDNFYFDRTRSSEVSLFPPTHSSSEDDEGLLFLSDKDRERERKREESKLSTSMTERNDLDLTSHRANKLIDLNIDDAFAVVSNEGGGSDHQQIDVAVSEGIEKIYRKSSKGSKTSSNHYGGEDTHSISSSSSEFMTPTGNSRHSHSSGSGHGNGNGIYNNRNNRIQSPIQSSIQQPLPTSAKSSSPPPPISSLHIIRKSNTTIGTATTMGNSGSSTSSPHLGRIKQSLSSSSQQQPRLSRKEIKRLRKRIEQAEEKEDYVQYLLRDGHNDSLDWSGHVPEEIQGMNRGVAFFPKENNKPRDFPFAVLFLAQLSTIILVATRYAGETMLNNASVDTHTTEEEEMMLNDDPFSSGPPLPNENSSPISIWAKDIYVDYTNAVQLACITGLYATVLSALAIGMMMILSTAFIPTVLCLTVVICVAFGTIMMALSPYTVLPVLGLAALALSLAYSIVVWDRIPFATTNLHTALVGMKSSADILLIGFTMMLVSFLWTITWMIAFLGIYDHYLDNADHELSNSITWVGLGVTLGMFTSYVWTFHVIMNIVHVTVAGVIGAWWTSPDAISTCCTNVCREHFLMSITKSFGSVCLGSLVVPPLDVLHFFLLFICPQSSTKPRSISLTATDHSSHDVGSIMGDKSVKSDVSPASFQPQMTSPLDGIMTYFNDFGFTYVGIYRKSFISSSEKATEIFKARGWSGVVADRLIPYILRIICYLITFGSGFFGLVVEEYDGYSFTNFRKPTSTAFIIGCFVGYVLSSVCLKVVESTVSTVLVCFSVAPYAFKYHHPMLSNEMRASWGGTWLDEMSIGQV